MTSQHNELGNMYSHIVAAQIHNDINLIFNKIARDSSNDKASLCCQRHSMHYTAEAISWMLYLPIHI